jgi:hypothetical protein
MTIPASIRIIGDVRIATGINKGKNCNPGNQASYTQKHQNEPEVFPTRHGFQQFRY